MDIAFQPATLIDKALRNAALDVEGLGPDFNPQVRPADPRFGDFQANGVLPHAKTVRANPRALGAALLEALHARGELSPEWVTVELAGPGFINFRLTDGFLSEWIKRFAGAKDFQSGASALRKGRKIIIDYPSANTAKQAHIGHLRPMVIGESIARLLDFCGANLIRDNHIGDWGTNFGTLIMIIKRKGIELPTDGEEALILLDSLYKEGSALEREQPEIRDESRNELVKLQQGDPENTRLWQRIVDLSNVAFEKIFDQLDVHIDVTLGESFYRDKVERVYKELETIGLAEVSDGALVVWHDEVPRFSRDNERPFPFSIRKRDGASNYGSTDLATVLYRLEELDADEIIYLTDSRQQDHFEQLFLTTEKWFEKKDYRLPILRHVWFGAILGEDKRPLKTKSGESVKLQALLDEARSRALAVVTEKNPDLPPEEREAIAEAVGIGAVKYADLSSNRTSDYVFSWDKLLNFEGNTAPYLLYAVARIHSIFRRAELNPGEGLEGASGIETDPERALARRLVGFGSVLESVLDDLRPHVLCTYLYDLAGDFSGFYNADKVMVDDSAVRARRLILCARTLLVLETGLHLLGLRTLERM